MRRLVLLAALLLAGCLAPSATEDGAFRFVEVVRDVRMEQGGGPGICGFPSTPEVDHANRTVTFHGDWPGHDHAVLLLVVAWDRSGCGTASTGWAVSQEWRGTLEANGLAFELLESGALRVGDRVVEPGQTATWSEEGTREDGRAWTATTTVRDHGQWPLEGIRQASP